jgi:hypothetical protein
MGMLAPLGIYAIERFCPNILLKGYPIEGIIFSLLGGTFDAIFTAGRSSRTPLLTDRPSHQGGLQFASVCLTAVIAIAFGFLATAFLRCFNPPQSINKDNMTWFIDQ